MTTLRAEKRSMSIKAKRLRREGFITGSIFDGEISKSTPVRMERTMAERLLKTCDKSSRILLDVDGQVSDALIRDVCFNSMKGLVEETDFQALVSGEKVHSVAEVTLLDRDKATSGVSQRRIQEISYKALSDVIIDKVRVNVGDMKIGNITQIGDLDIAENKNIEFVTDLDTTVATIIAVHAAVETTDETASETEQIENVL